MPAPALSAAGLSHRYGRGSWLFEDLTLSVRPGELLRVRGGNGTGKSTLLRLLATAVASRSVLAAPFAWLVVLAAVYAADAGPPLPALAVTATLLLPIADWATAAQLAAGSADLRQLLTAADGRARVLVVDALPPLLWVLTATAAGGLADLVLDPHPAP